MNSNCTRTWQTDSLHFHVHFWLQQSTRSWYRSGFQRVTSARVYIASGEATVGVMSVRKPPKIQIGGIRRRTFLVTLWLVTGFKTAHLVYSSYFIVLEILRKKKKVMEKK